MVPDRYVFTYIGLSKYRQFIETMNEYEMYLFELGATLEAIAWYRKKKMSMEEEWRMCSEYRSDPKEAFQSTGRPYFPRRYVEQLEKPAWNLHSMVSLSETQ